MTNAWGNTAIKACDIPNTGLLIFIGTTTVILKCMANEEGVRKETSYFWGAAGGRDCLSFHCDLKLQ